MKNSGLTLLLLCILTVFANAQENKTTTDTNAANGSFFSAGLFLTPTFNYRTLKALDESVKDNISDANKTDVPALLFEIGGRLNLQMGNRFRLTTGAIYAKKGYQTKFEFNDSLGNLIGNYRAYTNYDYIEVPVLLSFAVSKDSSKTFYIIGGISNGFLNKRLYNYPNYDPKTNVVNLEDDKADATELEARGYSMYQFAWIAGLEGNFMISDNVSLMVQPNFKYFITPLRTKDLGIGKVIQENLYSVGISFGVDYHF